MSIIGKKKTQLSAGERKLLILRRRMTATVSVIGDSLKAFDRIISQSSLDEVKAQLNAEESGDGDEFEALYTALVAVQSLVPVNQAVQKDDLPGVFIQGMSFGMRISLICQFCITVPAFQMSGINAADISIQNR